MSPSTSTFFYLLFFFVSLTALIPFCFALRFSFLSFQQNEQSLAFSDNSNVDKQVLQVTRNSAVLPISITNTSGQITYKESLQLWHSSYNYSASFSTSFLLNIDNLTEVDDDSDSTGGGMAFYLSSHPAFPSLSNSFGEWLGLFDGSVIAPAQQQAARLVAIEFDTFKDSFDPDNNHVGVDINGSVKSASAVSLNPWNVTLANSSEPSGMYTSVWIDYDGHLHTLDVYLANQGSEVLKKPAEPIISRYSIDLRNHLPETVFIGFSASVGTILEAHCVIEWNFTSTDFPNDAIPIAIIVGCSIGGAAIALLILVLVIICVIRRRRRGWEQVMADLSSLHYGPRKFSYQELKRATKGFSEECKLGKGGFGPVYKGVLASKSMKTEVAVKCLSQKSNQGEKEFKAEVMSMGRMRHKNLVQLLGWSYSGRSKLMLVYEYLPNGSLDQWIGKRQADERGEVMGWERRYHVMKGLAAGLAYLHEEWEMVVLHRDLKPSNVMLDAEFNARIGDFGLAKLVSCNQPGSAETATIAGTPGYLAPECIEQGIVSKESDMYSVGSIAIELATGCRLSASYLYTLSLLLKNSRLHEAADPQLPSFDPAQLELLLKIGLACCHPDPPERLSIREVVHALSSSSISSISVPAIRFPSPSTFSHELLQDSSSSSVSLFMENPDGR